ncbi:MAG: class I tRNA ligase family protein, partial [Planctomycetes bacterium]|nr:class I tRNA ligase family protein [Planctomycetota bacterium]
ARGAIVPAKDAVEDGQGGFRHRESGQPLTREIAKMSKSLHNVVNPDDVVREYGADTLRLYEMFLGPLADAKPWNDQDVPGVHRFLARVWRLVVPEDTESGETFAYLREDRAVQDEEIERQLHRTIAKVEGDVRRLAFNTAISAMMIWVNVATKNPAALTRDQALRFVRVLAPFAPHLAEELWARLRGPGLLAHASWPLFDPAQLVDSMVEYAVQVNGKVRERVTVPTGAADQDVLAAARAQAAAHLAGRQVVKEVVVRGRLVNFVVK